MLVALNTVPFRDGPTQVQLPTEVTFVLNPLKHCVQIVFAAVPSVVLQVPQLELPVTLEHAAQALLLHV